MGVAPPQDHRPSAVENTGGAVTPFMFPAAEGTPSRNPRNFHCHSKKNFGLRRVLIHAPPLASSLQNQGPRFGCTFNRSVQHRLQSIGWSIRGR